MIMFICAASVKDTVIIRQLGILAALSRFMPDLWVRDPEMMSVVLMSDPEGGGFKMKEKEGYRPTAASRARLGQTIVLLELIGRIREARLAQKETVMASALFSHF